MPKLRIKLKGAVDQRLQKQQAGFRQDRSCRDHIATLHIVVEQSIEWNSLLYVSFVGYKKKAFDSTNRETLEVILTLWSPTEHFKLDQELL